VTYFTNLEMIEWRDSLGCPQGWVDQESFFDAQNTNDPIVSIGATTRETDLGLWLVPSVDPGGFCMGAVWILKAQIVKRTKLVPLPEMPAPMNPQPMKEDGTPCDCAACKP
jgi:hypothetical protein